MRILTLDDMQIRQDEFRKWFIGTEHIAVATAKEAIDALGGPAFDLVCLDHDLAEEHYLELSEGMSEMAIPGSKIEYSPGTGMDVVDFLVQQAKADAPNVPRYVVVHSYNPGRAAEMVRRLYEAGYQVMRMPFGPSLRDTLWPFRSHP